MTVPRPYYVAPGASDATRTILLVSPAFPPCAEVGALRWQKIAEFAVERGWRLDVITGAASPRDRMDDSRLLALPPGTRVWTLPLRASRGERLQQSIWQHLRPLIKRNGGSAPAAEPPSSGGGATPHPGPKDRNGRKDALVRALRARNFFASWLRWRDDVETLARAIANERMPDVVISSGPPHMTHEAARAVSHALQRPLVIDLRDPMFVDHAEPRDLASDTWKENTSRYESLACRSASLIVVNTAASGELLSARYPDVRDRVLTVMNGADPDVRSHAGRSESFRILHAGNLYGGRDPRVLFGAIRRFLESLPGAPTDVRVDFVGGQAYEGVPLVEIAKASGIDAYFTSGAAVPRTEALRLLGTAAVLVVLPQAWSLSIPAKVFEYIQFDAALLALCEPNDATWQLLKPTGADVVDASNEGEIAAALTRRYAQWRTGERPAAINADGRFDRRAQAESLFDALDRIIAVPASR